MTGFRVGTGYDIHRLVPYRALVLGGVRVPYEKGLLGHSDADVLAHAVTDALLGAAGLPDIGELFPDTDPSYEGADSLELLSRAAAYARERGYVPVNADVTVICQRPKLSPYKKLMAENLARCLDLPADFVNVKAKTKEGLGPEGEGSAISAQAVVLVTKL